MVKQYYCFIFLFFSASFLGAQIKVKKGVSPTKSLYDSLKTYSYVFEKDLLIGQKLIFPPLSEIEARKGYYNVFNEPVDFEKLTFEDLVLPKDRKKIYQPNPSYPNCTDYKSLCMTKWELEKLIYVSKDELGMMEPDYLKLKNDKGETIYYFCHGVAFAYNFIIEGYFLKAQQKYIGKQIVTRKNVMLKDVFTNQSVSSLENEVWTVKDLVVSCPKDDFEGSLFLLLSNAKGNQIIVPPYVTDVYYRFAEPVWQFLFADLAWKKDFKINDEMWLKLMRGIPEIGMTKTEALICVGLLDNGYMFDEVERYLEFDDWNKPMESLHIKFKDNKIVEIMNYEYQNIPHSVKAAPRRR